MATIVHAVNVLPVTAMHSLGWHSLAASYRFAAIAEVGAELQRGQTNLCMGHFGGKISSQCFAGLDFE